MAELVVDISKSPVAQDDFLSASEDANVVGNVLTDNGLGPDEDPNIGQDVFVARVNGATNLVGMVVSGSNGGLFTIGSNGDLIFDPGTDFDHLASGETATTTVQYTIDDGTGLQDTATVTMEVVGVNDAPTADGTIADQTTPSGSSISPLDVSSYFDDVDSGTLTYGDGGTLPQGLFIDTATGEIRGTVAPGAGNLGVHVVVITATDSGGAEVSQEFEWLVAKSSPVAIGDVLTTTEDDSLSVPAISGLLSNDYDFDGDALNVTHVNGVSVVPGQPIDLPSGAVLVLQSDGSFTYDPNGKFEGLVLGESGADTFTYTVSDADGNTSSATVFFNVTGENDLPVANDDWWVLSDAREATDGAGVLSNDVDPDSNSTLTVVEVNGESQVGTEITLPSGAVLTLYANGTYLYDPSNIELAESGEATMDSFTYTIMDNQGLRSTATVTVQIQQQFAFDAFTNQALEAAPRHFVRK